MARPLVLLACAVVLASIAGCGTKSDEREVREVTERFYAAIDDEDGKLACEQLSQDTAEEVEASAKQPCEKAILDEDLSGGEVASVAVFTGEASADAGGETVFLDKGDDGWHISAAGCEPRTEAPYDCEVES